ncbi:ABC-2 type transport system ATP-binding protein [Enterococcus sp. AZ194]|uniref:ABC transporter ATP-binding protein n=1 Tax=Enterococcus sp. AZ194 TaxID=2774629 RepID=UPI003F264300
MKTIQIENITKSYGTQDVLKGITLHINKGEIFTLLGENGAGKSTLINLLTTLIRPTSGTALVMGFDVQKQSDAVRQMISLNSQSITLDEEFTGIENLKLIGLVAGVEKLDQRIEVVSKRLHLEDFLHKKVSTYSGGMKRRLDIAVSILPNTEVLFLDEPTTGVDPKNRIEIWELILELKAEGKTIFLTTQYLDEADKLSDRIAFLNDGTISLIGTPAELKKQARDLQQITVPSDTFKQTKQLLAEQKITFAEESFAVVVDGNDLQKSLKLLINSDIPVLATTPIELTLEEIFLDATRKDEAK